MARTRSRKRRPAGARRASAGTAPKPSSPAEPRRGAGASDGVASGPEGASGRDVPSGPTTARAGASRANARGASGAKTRGASRTSPVAPTYGERPRSPWHPLPLSELLILVGAIGAAIGFAKSAHGFSNGGPAVLAGIGAVAIGTIEVALREHRSGYRSHTILLAAIPVLVFTSVAVLGLSAVMSVPRLLVVGVFAVDIALFALLFKVLRARFLDARHARVVREG